MRDDWRGSLDVVVARTKHERYRVLCRDDHPDHEVWRARVIAMAGGKPPPPPPPSPPRQAASLAGSFWDWATAGFRMSPPALVAERRSICAGCEHWDTRLHRCRICGCFTEVKIRLRTEHCPIKKW